MNARIALDAVDRVEVRTLIDNVSDMLLLGRNGIERAPMAAAAAWRAPVVEAPLMLDPHLPEMLVAEHGFSALVTVTKGERTRHLMFDAGLSVGGLSHNLRALQLNIADVEAIVMSHGHFDHVGGLNGLIREGGVSRLPMLLHPDFWLRRRITIPGQAPIDLPATSKGAIQGAGFAIIEGRAPSLLMDGSVLITGEVDRTTEFERGMAVHEAWRDEAWTPDPLILDDQALIVRIEGKGLLILTGCGHAGIVNIVRHAQALTGETRVAAIIGGFHLNGPFLAPFIAPTVDALAACQPSLIVPAHCTGFEAVRAISLAMPDAFALNSVGTKYTLSSAIA